MKSSIAIACATFIASATTAHAGLSFGMYAELDFQQTHMNSGGHYLDFESVGAGTNLLPGTDPFGVGAQFASIINTNGFPFGPEHVEVSNRHRAAEFGNSLVGSPFELGSDDARVGYEITFDNPQARAGLRRIWNTNSLTRFYNAEGDLLAEHQNTTSAEFVGWIADAQDQSTWVSRIVMDGLDVGSRQVGHTDDLYFGRVVPAPGSIALVTLAGLITTSRRR